MSTETLRILVIGYVWPEPNSSAAGQNMMSLLEGFSAQKHQVTFMTAATDSVHKADLDAKQIDVIPVALNCDSFDQQVRMLSPHVVIFDRYMTEEQFSWRVKAQCPQALRILNTEDLHSLRQARHNAVKQGQSAFQAELNTELAQREVAAILRSDLTLVISKAEYQLLARHYQVPTSQLRYHPLRPASMSRDVPTFEVRKDIVTIGNFRHAPNWDAVLQLKQLWPHIRRKVPGVNLRVYGAYPPKKATQLHDAKSGFYVEGWAENAHEVIANARLLISPLRFGAGIKGKLIDAMQCGTPSITTSIGAEGIMEDVENPASHSTWGGAICHHNDDYIHEVSKLYNDENAWTNAQTNGFNLLQSLVKGAPEHSLVDTVEHLVLTIDQHRAPLFLQSMLWHHTLTASKYMSQWIAAKNAIKRLR
ncbi:glycosyltransferase family 4 protein [Alteromonas sp. KUL49]|uniref:glycosyltransferase family 4 protein n=1 Tax=Alteromonas sp. KUL49 TaxID=2480798 RepID=UPI00102F034B|nr:glycosyltransferase family 4 protein [Alteromonas sp. KUL49]TAP40199.1 glycosyltransferase [Alteromonas sp. KUL49]GEA11326.1 glycosyl transferase [Alteromonas sp. KUL49]